MSTEDFGGPASIFELKKPEENNELLLPCSVYGVPVDFVVDTSAAISMIHAEKYFMIPQEERPQLFGSGLQLRMTDGRIIP